MHNDPTSIGFNPSMMIFFTLKSLRGLCSHRWLSIGCHWFRTRLLVHREGHVPMHGYSWDLSGQKKVCLGKTCTGQTGVKWAYSFWVPRSSEYSKYQNFRLLEKISHSLQTIFHQKLSIKNFPPKKSPKKDSKLQDQIFSQFTWFRLKFILTMIFSKDLIKATTLMKRMIREAMKS